MNIDWPAFTPAASLIGGILLGIAATALLLLNGRIAGVSSIAAGLLKKSSADDIRWRIAFIAGLVAAPLLYSVAYQRPVVVLAGSFWLLASAGLLTGIGTGLGSGCTSGHGVCGLARQSPRSLVATLCFMAAGFITVFAVRHLLGFAPQ